MIEIVQAGMLNSVQDTGRPGYRHLGVSAAGALDALALEVGNRLVGNAPTAAAIEATLGPLVLRFTRAVRVALTGAAFDATVDGRPVFAWWSVPVAAGQELVLQRARRGMRGYVCVRGGIEVLPMLGSRSTDLAARFGGLGGRALRKGDRLATGTAAVRAGADIAAEAPPFGVKAPEWCRFAALEHEPPRRGNHVPGAVRAVAIRALRGPEYESFSNTAHEAFWSDEWRVTPQSNRMGYRLAGTALTRATPMELLSHAVLPGTIQVPPGGQPIVLMSDAQTTGGYARIGIVIHADLWKLAQIPLNTGIRFVPCSRDEALAALREQQAYLRQIDVAMAMHEERLHRSMKAA